MSASPNPNAGFHWHVPPGNVAPPIFMPASGTGHEALQALLAFSALHDQVRRQTEAGVQGTPTKSWQIEKFVLDEVLQLVAERASALTGANGVAIALAEGDEIICRASSGTIAPDRRAKLNPNSGFSGTCFRTGQIVRCDDTENDPRVNVQAARRLGTRSMVAVPLAGKNGTIGLIEAFSSRAYAFQDGSIRSLNLLAELILAAMKPEEEHRTVETLQVSGLVEEPVVESGPNEPVRTETPVLEPQVEVISENIASEVVERLPVLHFHVAETRRTSQPGLKIVLAIVLLAALAGTGVWWKLRASQTTNTSPVRRDTAAQALQPSQPDVNLVSVTPGGSSAHDKGNELTAITGVRHWSSPTSTIVMIDLQDHVAYQEHRISDPDRIYFDLPDTTLTHVLSRTTDVDDSKWLVHVRVAQPTPGVTRVVLDTKNNPAYTVSVKQEPYRLEVDVHSADAPVQPKAKLDLFGPTGLPLAPTSPVQSRVAPISSFSTSPASTGKTSAKTQVPKFRVALDAGHGGWDEGTIGRRGLMEKDLALDIVARLGKLVAERLGGEVIYTRRDDTYIPLEKRAEIANLSQADFFVSIHANYSDTPSARGVETYYSNTYSSLNARMPGTDNTVQPVNWTNVDLREKALLSQRLASSVQNALYGKLARTNSGLPDRGVKKASYVVLTGTTMPAILAEVSFVSSPADEKSLKRSAYRQSIAEALYKGIARFVAVQHKVTMASASSKPAGR